MPRSKRMGPKGGETTKTPGGLQRVAILLTEEQYAELRRLAYERQESQSAIIREAFDAYLESCK
jgi:predicted DNA-binding protein